MSSVYKTNSGVWKYAASIRYQRFVIYLGCDLSLSAIQSLRMILDSLVSLRRASQPINPALFSLLPENISISLRKQGFFDFGDVQKKRNVLLFKSLLSRFESLNVQLLSNSFYKRARIYLLEYFKLDVPCNDFNRDTVEAFVNYLLVTRDYPLSSFAIHKLWRFYVKLFDYAVEHNYINENPFRVVHVKPQRKTKTTDVPRDIVYKVMDICDNPEHRLALAFGRFCGFRVPSELLCLHWSDITNNVIHIQYGKTGGRVFPLVPAIDNELRRYREYCERISRDVTDGFVFVDLREHTESYLSSCIVAYLKRLGLPRWVRMFNSLRASCITDYVKSGTVPESTIDAMFGNSTMIRKKFYIKARQSDFDRVTMLTFDERDQASRSAVDKIKELLPLLSPDDIEKILLHREC